MDEPEDSLPLDGPPSADLRWQYRHGQPAAASEALVKGLAGLDLPGEPGVAYLAGEAAPRSSCSAVTSSPTAAGQGRQSA